MSEHEHEHDTEGTGSATSAASDGATDRTADSTSPEGEETEREAGAGEGPFGGLTPGEASRLRWERARAADDNPEASDPRRKMARSLQKKAENGDTKAFELWRRLTDELEEERLARDGADGARAWEQITPEQRRLLLSVLEGKALVLQGEDAEEWKRHRAVQGVEETVPSA